MMKQYLIYKLIIITSAKRKEFFSDHFQSVVLTFSPILLYIFQNNIEMIYLKFGIFKFMNLDIAIVHKVYSSKVGKYSIIKKKILHHITFFHYKKIIANKIH